MPSITSAYCKTPTSTYRKVSIRPLQLSVLAATPRGVQAVGMTQAQRLPKLVAFDLDATLWWPEMYMLSGGTPFKRDAHGSISDRRGEAVTLMGISQAILAELATGEQWRANGTQVAYASRCDEPAWAAELLTLFEVAPGVTMHGLAEHHEIYPGRKTKHFKAIQQRTGIAYEDMIFFDNEYGNIEECTPLGITCVYTPQGMTEAVWREGLARYADPSLAPTAAPKGRRW